PRDDVEDARCVEAKLEVPVSRGRIKLTPSNERGYPWRFDYLVRLVVAGRSFASKWVPPERDGLQERQPDQLFPDVDKPHVELVSHEMNLDRLRIGRCKRPFALDELHFRILRVERWVFHGRGRARVFRAPYA